MRVCVCVYMTFNVHQLDSYLLLATSRLDMAPASMEYISTPTCSFLLLYCSIVCILIHHVFHRCSMSAPFKASILPFPNEKGN